MASVPSRRQFESAYWAGTCGIGIYGPDIDKYGNSIGGVKILETLATEYNLNIF